MKCPQCGLVHLPTDIVCRRCEINLKTGEPMSRAAACKVETRTPDKPAPTIREKLLKRGRTALPRAEEERAKPARRAPLVEVVVSTAKPEKAGTGKASPKGGRIRQALAARRRRKNLAISCAQCASEMELERDYPFSAAWPVALLAAAVALFAAGFFFALLFIPAAVAAAAGILYLRTANTRFRCRVCGFAVPRN